MYKKIELELDNGIFEYYKKSLQTRFCFRYDEISDCRCGTNTISEAQKASQGVTLEYFIQENTRDIDRLLDNLTKWHNDKDNCDLIPTLIKRSCDNVCYLVFKRKVDIIEELGGSAYPSEIYDKAIDNDSLEKLIDLSQTTKTRYYQTVRGLLETLWQ